jgi:hypothetical protein
MASEHFELTQDLFQYSKTILIKHKLIPNTCQFKVNKIPQLKLYNF